MKLINIIFIFLLFALAGCGFKVIDQNSFEKYRFSEIQISGDNRVVYLFKNYLKVGNNNSPNIIKLKVDTKKTKQISEKNIQNEVTKYKITINADVNFYDINKNKSGKYVISREGDYEVSKRYNTTLNNEKTLTKNLIKNISDQILKNLLIRLNDN